MVYHTSKIEGDGAGYDIASVNEKKKLFILKSRLLLVKETPFYISQNEKTFLKYIKKMPTYTEYIILIWIKKLVKLKYIWQKKY